MTLFPTLEAKDKFMLAAIEGPHAAVVLGPDTQSFQLGVHLLACPEKFTHVAPIHTDKMNGTASTVFDRAAKIFPQKVFELRFV